MKTLLIYSPLILIGFFFLCLTTQANGQNSVLQCFNCTTQGEDLTCLTNPDKITNGETGCDNGWCEIIREEHTEIPGSVVTFYRGCALKQPLFLNDIVSNAHITTYYTTCRSNKCNSGNGLKTTTGSGGIGGGGIGGSGYIIVLGEESSGEKVLARTGLSLIMALIALKIIL